MQEWALLKCLKCDFPHLVPSDEFLEIANNKDLPFMYCPKCGVNINVSQDSFQEHIMLPLEVKKVIKYKVKINK